MIVVACTGGVKSLCVRNGTPPPSPNTELKITLFFAFAVVTGNGERCNHCTEEMQVADKDVSNGSASYEPCLTEQLWEELSAEIENYLTTISLADMMQNDEVRELSRVHDLRQNQPNLL